MYPHIICFCGRSLGDLYDIFKLLRAERYAAAYKAVGRNIDPAMIGIIESLQVDIGDVFELLHLHLPCCRARIMTQVEFNSIY